MVDSTSDPAFAVDAGGFIVAWNSAAETLFALKTDAAVGQPCGSIVRGTDECGPVCSQDCTIRQAVERRHSVSNFDLQVEAASGRRWCNVSVLVAENGTQANRFVLHIMRPVELRKRLELLVRDFVVSNTNVPPTEAVALISSTRAAAKEAKLSDRELEILQQLAKGNTTAGIANLFHISRTTVNNHVQHILRKLNAHTRLEAIRRAEHAGLI
jgi:DNA-binding CsgD family transcriptional regulator